MTNYKKMAEENADTAHQLQVDLDEANASLNKTMFALNKIAKALKAEKRLSKRLANVVQILIDERPETFAKDGEAMKSMAAFMKNRQAGWGGRRP